MQLLTRPDRVVWDCDLPDDSSLIAQLDIDQPLDVVLGQPEKQPNRAGREPPGQVTTKIGPVSIRKAID